MNQVIADPILPISQYDGDQGLFVGLGIRTDFFIQIDWHLWIMVTCVIISPLSRLKDVRVILSLAHYYVLLVVLKVQSGLYNKYFVMDLQNS